jgi:hypothetical protein
MEPKETLLVRRRTMAKTPKLKAKGSGVRTKYNPVAVATPFPPLNLRKAGKRWPKKAQSPNKNPHSGP